ncbi:hypothetical protein LSAT2_013977 [Lamellibrachia satsuma]|nr:hypothetical protein LSAT2_013977 [Lamellibrachia satsuma]
MYSYSAITNILILVLMKMYLDPGLKSMGVKPFEKATLKLYQVHGLRENNVLVSQGAANVDVETKVKDSVTRCRGLDLKAVVHPSIC